MKPVKTRRAFLSVGLYALAGCTSLKRSDPSQQSNSFPRVTSANLRSAATFETVDEIVIDRPVKQVFSFLTNLENSDRISDNLKDTRILKGGRGIGSQYSRKLMIHGVANDQIVTVTDAEENRMFQTSTELFGIQVVHTYRLESDGNGLVKISLAKQSFNHDWIDRVYQPFVKHQLTRPEHDGQHLITLKMAVETA